MHGPKVTSPQCSSKSSRRSARRVGSAHSTSKYSVRVPSRPVSVTIIAGNLPRPSPGGAGIMGTARGDHASEHVACDVRCNGRLTSPDDRLGGFMGTPLAPDLLQRIHAYWRAANYLSVGQIYLMDNPLLKTKLRLEHVKPRLLGHWGTTPGLNFIYVHLNRLIKAHDLSVIYITGPGHGGPGTVANTYLEGTYSESYPQLLVAAVVGDGEAETGPLATSWHSNKFLNPVHDGAVLPILHLNGYKIAGPTVLARLPHDELDALLRGYGHAPRYVEGHEPELMHQKMAEALDECLAEITRIQKEARAKGFTDRPRWPVIVLRSPKGWTGPKVVDGEEIEGTFHSHQVPLAELAEKPEHLEMLEQWMKSYKPEELFDAAGRFKAELQALAPTGPRRMGANPHANGGVLLRDLRMPDFHTYAVAVPNPGAVSAEATRIQGRFIRDVLMLNADSRNFRVVSPDELTSNRWNDVFEVTDRCSTAEILPTDDHVSPDGRVMEMLSEHQCEG